MTPYQQKILDRCLKKVSKIKLGEPSKDEIIQELLTCLEERDKVLTQHYFFFGPSREESRHIARAMEQP